MLCSGMPGTVTGVVCTRTGPVAGETYEGNWSGGHVVGRDTAAPLDPRRCALTATRQGSGV
jgi:hypothetical protein